MGIGPSHEAEATMTKSPFWSQHEATWTAALWDAEMRGSARDLGLFKTFYGWDDAQAKQVTQVTEDFLSGRGFLGDKGDLPGNAYDQQQLCDELANHAPPGTFAPKHVKRRSPAPAWYNATFSVITREPIRPGELNPNAKLVPLEWRWIKKVKEDARRRLVKEAQQDEKNDRERDIAPATSPRRKQPGDSVKSATSQTRQEPDTLTIGQVSPSNEIMSCSSRLSGSKLQHKASSAPVNRLTFHAWVVNEQTDNAGVAGWICECARVVQQKGEPVDRVWEILTQWKDVWQQPDSFYFLYREDSEPKRLRWKYALEYECGLLGNHRSEAGEFHLDLLLFPTRKEALEWPKQYRGAYAQACAAAENESTN
jgi:hypothetical protein